MSEPTNPLHRYQDVREIARGGMGTIHRAHDAVLEREVALKTLGVRGADPRSEARFLREARITGRLEHPNIVPVHALGTDSLGRRYFSMKLVKGRSLSGVLAELARSEPDHLDAATLQRFLHDFLKICDGVAYAHSLGIIHRDLKPANVMIGEFGEVLVLDWGLARTRNAEPGTRKSEEDPAVDEKLDAGAGEELTRDGAVVGTLAYMPPEQAEGQIGAIDERSDIYSLGAILYEILALAPPFAGKSSYQILDAVVRGDLPPPSARAPWKGVPRELEAVVMRAMSREKGDRYRSVQELAADIGAYLAGRTLRAIDYGLLARLGKCVARKRKVATGLAALIAVALAIGAIQAAREAGLSRDRLDGARRDAELAIGRAREISPAIPPRTTSAQEGSVDPAAFEARERALDAWLEAAEALERELALEPTDEALSSRRDAGIELGRVAIGCGDYALARRAFRDLARFGAGADEVEAFLVEVEAARTEVLAARERRLREILEDLSTGLSRSARRQGGSLLEDYVFEASAFSDPGSSAILARSLEPMIAKGVAEGQAAIWTEGEESVARFACRVLGRIGVEVRDPGIPRVLARWLRALWDVDLAIEAALALSMPLSSEAAEPVLAARGRFAGRQEFWRRVGRWVARIPGADLSSEAAESYVRRGAGRLTAGDPAGALFDCDVALGIDPASAAAYALRAEVHHAGGRTQDALADCQRALEVDERCVPALLVRGRALLATGTRLREAASSIDTALEIDPELPTAYLVRAEIRIAGGQIEWARADLDSYRTFEEGPVEETRRYALALARSGDPLRALRDLTNSIRQEPEGVATLFAARAEIRSEIGDVEDAVLDLTAAIEASPESPDLHEARALAYEAALETDLAIADWSAALESSPSRPRALAERGRLFAARGDLPAALADFERAIAAGGDPTAFEGHARIHLQAGEYERAIEDASRAVVLDPRRAGPYAVRSRARHARGDRTNARLDATSALERDPTNAAHYVLRGDLERWNSSHSKAIADYERALVLDRTSADAFFGIAWSRYGQQELAAARQAAARGLEFDGTSAASSAARGLVRRIDGDREVALAEFGRALEIDPKCREALVERMEMRYRARDDAGAVADASAALEIDPGSSWLWIMRANARNFAGDPGGALADSERAIALHPGFAWAHLARGDSRSRLGELDSAIADYRRAIELEPANWKAWASLGSVLARKGDTVDARSAYARALELAGPENRSKVEAMRRSALEE